MSRIKKLLYDSRLLGVYDFDESLWGTYRKFKFFFFQLKNSANSCKDWTEHIIVQIIQ